MQTKSILVLPIQQPKANSTITTGAAVLWLDTALQTSQRHLKGAIKRKIASGTLHWWQLHKLKVDSNHSLPKQTGISPLVSPKMAILSWVQSRKVEILTAVLIVMSVMVLSSMVNTSTWAPQPSPTLWGAGDQALSQRTARAARRMGVEIQSFSPQELKANSPIEFSKGHFAPWLLVLS